MKVIEKFNTFTPVKKLVLVSGSIFTLLFLGSFGSTTNQSSTPNDTAEQQSLQQSVDLTEKQPISTTETRSESKTETITFESITKNDSSVEQGRTIKSVYGVAGERTITYEVQYTDGQETSRKEVSSEITKEPITEVTLIGTKAPYVAPTPTPQASSSCDPNYSGGSVPNVSYDLNCPDIGFMVRIIGTDKHHFDGDKDGYGCESYN